MTDAHTPKLRRDGLTGHWVGDAPVRAPLGEFLTTPNQSSADAATEALMKNANPVPGDPYHRYRVSQERATIHGVGPDTPTETNAAGASQSKVPYAFTSLDAQALLTVAHVAAQGDAKYGEGNWRGIETRHHLNHAVTHIYAWLAGDRSDDHLAHAACRTLMALAQDQEIQRLGATKKERDPNG